MLAPMTGYALVRYADHPPCADLVAEGMTDRDGILQLKGTWRQWSRKFWLVQAADISRSGNRVTATAWHPERYLFEEKDLGVPCNCPNGQ
jgi:hypothetical protein